MKIDCNELGHDPKNEWVVRKDIITMGEWNRWRKAAHEPTQELVKEFITEYHLQAIPGGPIVDNFNDLPYTMFDWLVGAITDSILEERKVPTKN